MPGQPILSSKLAKLAYSPSSITLVFQGGLEFRNSDFKRFNDDHLTTSCKNSVDLGPVTLEVTRVKCTPPGRSAV